MMSKDERVIAEVMATEQAWVRAHQDLDMGSLERIMGEEYLAVDADGQLVDKQQTLASYGSGQRQWEVAQGDEYVVRVFDKTAVVVGRWRGVGTNHGRRFDYLARFISVYVKRDGGWQMVSAQSTPIVDQDSIGR